MPGKAPGKASVTKPVKQMATRKKAPATREIYPAEEAETKSNIKKSTSKKAVDGKTKKRKAKSKKESWSYYIYKVLKQVHPDTGMLSKYGGQ